MKPRNVIQNAVLVLFCSLVLCNILGIMLVCIDEFFSDMFVYIILFILIVPCIITILLLFMRFWGSALLTFLSFLSFFLFVCIATGMIFFSGGRNIGRFFDGIAYYLFNTIPIILMLIIDYLVIHIVSKNNYEKCKKRLEYHFYSLLVLMIIVFILVWRIISGHDIFENAGVIALAMVYIIVSLIQLGILLSCLFEKPEDPCQPEGPEEVPDLPE